MNKKLIIILAFILFFTNIFITEKAFAEDAIDVNPVKKVATSLYASDIVNVYWTKTKDVTGYIIYERIGDKYKRVKIIADNDITSYKVKNVSKGRVHAYALKTYVKTRDGYLYSTLSKESKISVPTVMTKRTKGYSKTTAAKLIKTAESKVGCRYVFGAEGPSSFDCSGYVYYITKKANVSPKKIKRTGATSMWKSLKSHSIGTKKLSKAQPGDIVFVSAYPNSSISHVAFYYGDNKYIHATNPREGVKVTPTRYYGYVKDIVRLPNM